MNQSADKLDIILALREGQAGTLLCEQLASYGLQARVFTRQSALLAQLHSQAPALLVLDEAGLDDVASDALIPLLRRLYHGELLCAGFDWSLQRQIALMRLGVNGFRNFPLALQGLIDTLDRQNEVQHSQPFRVLLVDDSEAVTRWVSTQLRQGGLTVQVLHNPLELFGVLERFQPDIILMDVYMPQCTGDEVARVVRQHPQFDSIPIVFLSTETSKGRQLQARSMGGDDFLIKDQDGEELLASVCITAERYRRLRHWMMRDRLTGLLDHTHLMRRLEQEVAQAQRQVLPLSFAMIDIDHFKQVNDSFGHAAGDQVIVALARLLRQMGGAELIGRYGGEEFALIFPGQSKIRAAQAVDQLRERFAQICHPGSNGDVLRVTLSAGVAQLADGQTGSALVELADQALYRAKHAGRNQVGLAP